MSEKRLPNSPITGANKYEVVPNHIDLKQKTGDGPAKLTKQQVQMLEKEIAAQRGVYMQVLSKDLKDLSTVIHKSKSANFLLEADKDISYAISHRIRGEAAMNGHSAVGIIANLLCEFIETPAVNPNKHISFLELHVGAMHAIYNAHNTGADSTQIQQIIEGFKAAKDKLSTDS